MARVKKIFCSSEKSEVSHGLEIYVNDRNEIYLSIKDELSDDPFAVSFTVFDLETAIEFHKELGVLISSINKNLK